jgi:large subunit ribosomal protein L32e
MSVRTLKDLPGLKEEHIAQLAEMGVNNVAEMKKALSDESKVKEMIKKLSGVGPKTVDTWKNALAAVDEKKADSVAATKDVKKEAKPVEVVEADAVDGEHTVKLKPELTEEMKDALAKRAIVSGNRPAFKRQEWFRYSKLGEGWRKPKGIHSKMKRKFKRRPSVVAIGFRGPALSRGLHPSGFEEKIVSNVNELEGVDPKKQAVRIAGAVGTKKRIVIEDRAEELGIRVLNRMV